MSRRDWLDEWERGYVVGLVVGVLSASLFARGCDAHAAPLSEARIDTVVVMHSRGLRCPCYDWELVRYQYGYVVDTLRTGSVNSFSDAILDSLKARHFAMWGSGRVAR